MPIRLLSFDLDDTLWPVMPTLWRAEGLMLEWMQANVPAVAMQHDVDSLLEHSIAFRNDHPEIAHCVTRLRLGSLRHLSEIHDHPDDWVEEAFAVFFSARQQVELYDDVGVTLDRLAGDYRMAGITNGNADIGLTGVDRWLEFCVSPEHLGVAKPDPGIFDELVRRAGVDKQEIVHIGDDPTSDVLGAGRVGIRTVWLNRKRVSWPHSEMAADEEIHDLHGLLEALSSLESDG